MKQCPFCKKELVDTAIRCKYCRRVLSGKEQPKETVFENKQETLAAGQHKKEIFEKPGSIAGYIRNKNIAVILFILLILLQAALGFSMAVHYHKIGRVLDKAEVHHMQLGINLSWGLFFSILFAWYMLTLKFTKKWWIFPTLLVVWFFSIYFSLLPWLILMAFAGIQYRKLCKIKDLIPRTVDTIKEETEEAIEKVVEEGKPRISGPAIFGFVLSFFTFFVPVVGQLVCFYVCGKVLYEIKQSNGLLKGKFFAIGGIVISIMILIVYAVLVTMRLSR